jgi:hypothetical protein
MQQQERTFYMLSELSTVLRRIEWHKAEDSMTEAQACAVALVEILESMAGLDEYPDHASCFDSDVSQAIRSVINAIYQRLHLSEQDSAGESLAHEKRPDVLRVHRTSLLSNFE